MFLGAAALAIRDEVRSGFGFWRFLIMLYGMELYDIVFFDWVLLCYTGFFPHFDPERKGVVGPHLFWYNKRAHLRHFLLDLPCSAVLAWVCTRF